MQTPEEAAITPEEEVELLNDLANIAENAGYTTDNGAAMFCFMDQVEQAPLQPTVDTAVAQIERLEPGLLTHHGLDFTDVENHIIKKWGNNLNGRGYEIKMSLIQLETCIRKGFETEKQEILRFLQEKMAR